jgi:hypothetical protein
MNDIVKPPEHTETHHIVIVMPVADPVFEVSVPWRGSGLPDTISLRGYRNDAALHAEVSDAESIHELLHLATEAIVKTLLRGGAVVIAARPEEQFGSGKQTSTKQIGSGE